MDLSKKVHPIFATMEYPSGDKTWKEEEGESYFERCAREFTAAALSNPNLTSDPAFTAQKGIQVALELERQLKLLTEVKKG
jgi:hypothetical protein